MFLCRRRSWTRLSVERQLSLPMERLSGCTPTRNLTAPLVNRDDIFFPKGEDAMSNEGVTNLQAESQRQWSKLAERACKDAELKQRLLNDPAPLLRGAGIAEPAGAEARVTEEH